MDRLGTLKSSACQKTKSMKKKQTTSKKSHSRTLPLSDEQKDNTNFISDQFSLLDLDRFPSKRNIMETRSGKLYKKSTLKQKHFPCDDQSSLSELFGQWNLNGSHLNRNLVNHKPLKKEKYNKTKNRSPQDDFHSFNFYNTANASNTKYDFIGDRRKNLGSQCSSLRSSMSSISSCDDEKYNKTKNKSPRDDFHSHQFYNRTNSSNKKYDFKGDRKKNLGAQCSSLRSSMSSIFSCEDLEEKIDLKINREKNNCHPEWKNKKLNNHRTSHLSNHFIKSWILKNDDLLTNLIMKNRESFKNLFSTHRKVNDMIVVFELLNRICELNDSLTKEYFLSFSLNQQFTENTESYLSCILLGSSKDMLKNLEVLLKFYSEIIHIIPSQNLDGYYEHLTNSLNKMEKIGHVPELMINNVKELITKISEKLNDMDSQFDISNLRVLPSPEDINEIPELQPNIITGPYEDPSHYLNVHFKLLKEDFVFNLRSGLQEYQTNLKEKKSSRIKDIFVYDAIYCGLKRHGRQTNLAVNFEIDNKKLKRVDWGTSKRLIHGSLLLISNDNFKTYYLTLLDDKRTPKSDDKNFVVTALIMDKLIQFTEYTKCTIIEPKVFFNPYYQVLKTIKKINPNIFPMEKYIIDARTEINPPLYLNKDTKYSIGGNEVKLDNIVSYEHSEIFALNEFQISALQAALTKEFVLIQGPPGTGKSYLGLKIINILLNNYSHWKKDASPILVICYRNNAVDQILESLIKDGRKIVRLGNQSNNELVKNCCLRSAISQIDSGIVFRDQIRTIKNQIETLKSQIAEMQSVINSINDKKAVLNIDSLSDVLTINQKQCLSRSNVFEEWLFGGDDKCDSNEALLDGLPIENLEYNSSLNPLRSSLLLLSVNDLINELSCLRGRIDTIYSHYGDLQFIGQDELLYVIEILQEYGIKELFLKKIVNRINLETDNFIDVTQLNPDDLFELSITERWTLYKYWANLFCKQGLEKIEGYLNQINEKQDTLQELNDMNDGHKVLQLNPDVVGATTTGAARTRSLLTVIKPKIVIFEEAAEVLECHTITALTQFSEHVIMIGDHQQLRPNPASHISAIKYKLDISLFERMIKNGIEYFTLNEQHRMRPLISSLVIPLFYPNLHNHSSVEKYPDVRGLRDNMFFVDHIIPEDELVDSESHRNKHEANFILALADYILKQGYDKEDLTILTFYGAQLLYLQAVRSKYPSLKGVSMQVVDNFQGQENKIILLSLVRSNPYSIGFLSKMNRICVALTRAREGFYLIGNMATLLGNSSVWKGINQILQDNKVIGNDLPLKCFTHGTITNVRTPDDFLPLKFGGCTLMCSARLECGHICELQCHGTDEFHLGTYSCQKPCERKAGCNIHDCKSLCGLPCPKCDVIVETELPCGHEGSKECEGGLLPCSSNCTDFLSCGHPCTKECHFPIPHLLGEYCPMPCDKPNINCPYGHKCSKVCGEDCGECEVKTITTMPCGHTVNGKCNDIKNKKCKLLLDKNLGCGHTVEVECYQFDSEVECTKTNLERLPCGHDIEIPCGETIKEKVCKEIIEKYLPCGHSITIPCHLSSEENIDCEELVEKELKCGHGFQLEKCSTPPEEILCKTKVNKIIKKCGHMVEVMCYMTSGKNLCQHPCSLIKPCGHNCSGLCGQPCPECQEMVETDQVCGHKGLSPCAVIADKETSGKNIETSLGSLNCETLCKSILKCGHECEGTCGTCMQGRVHKACTAVCGAVLLCGHECSDKCSLGIHLCDKKCLNICKHQACKNKCSQSCQKCKQKCEWQCEHFQCSKLCWEHCNRPICEASCKKLLPCGHVCSGFCGEPCPPVCITCTPQPTFESKYILLEDCGHSICKNEFSALISTTIGLFLCPRCQKPQTSSHYIRYYTRKWFIVLPLIRKKLLNKYNNVRGLITDTKSSLGRIHKLLKYKFYDFGELKLLLNGIIESLKTILLKQNKENCIESLRSLLFVSFFISEAFHLLQQSNQANDFHHLSRLNYLSSHLKKWETGISREQMYQFKDELYRLIVICKLKEIKENRKNNAENVYLDEAWQSACGIEVFSDDKQKNIVSLIKQTDSTFEISSKVFSNKFLSVFENYYSLTLHNESWMKCNKKGHIFYSLDKALSESKCPTCIDSKRDFLF
ncbi:NFX1-type zinc finger-containing protein 1 [Halyomorpha halys]|uniref:NFX1-type zinc finger-containing protein 1 n=1 Tax=Halyomorpha halys TaxID=286706 RepID=UPI0006D528F3|nr:NFX1-type zinc finger-containing protein 1-like [Halyomorpha halys]